MNRRELLASSAAGLTAGIGGCLGAIDVSDASYSDEAESDDSESAESDAELRFVGVYAAEADREFLDGEYLLLENGAGESADISEFVVEYSAADRTYRVADLVLEPGAQLALLSRSGRNATLQMSPPAYLRYAGFDTPVLGETGTVRVRNASGSIVAEASYEHFGCDGGTVTDGSGADVECLH